MLIYTPMDETMDNSDVSELQALKDRWTKEAYERGVTDGRELERKFILELLEDKPIAAPQKRTRKPRQPAATLPLETIAGFVQGALRELEIDNKGGVYPDTVATFLRDNPPSGMGMEVSVRQVRQALRQMTMTGHARRMARGKYLPIDAETQRMFSAAE